MSTTPRTIAVPLHPNQPTASYSLASGLAQFVESVYIEVDNTAGADARPLLTLSEQSGVVIGKKRQGDAITGGTSGSATWALRLTDESPASGTAAGFIKYVFDNVGAWLNVATTSVRGGVTDPNNNNSVVFTVPDSPTPGLFVVKDSAGDTVFTAGSGGVGNYGVAIVGGGTGSLDVNVPFEIHSVQGGTFRVTTCSLADIIADTTQITGKSLFVDVTNGAPNLAEIDGNVLIALASVGQTFNVIDHLGNPIFTLTG